MSGPFIALIAAAIVLVGMALALSQFCMVRAVLSVKQGLVSPARCVLAISLAIGLCLQLLALLQGGEIRPTYALAPRVLLGGLLFGIAARRNGGCYIGTVQSSARGSGGGCTPSPAGSWRPQPCSYRRWQATSSSPMSCCLCWPF